MEDQNRVLEEKQGQVGQPVRPFDDMYRTALGFLAKPHETWANGSYAVKRAVLKLALTDRITYDRKSGYRTPDFSLPFKVLEDFNMLKKQMVPGGGIEPPTRGFSILCSTN